MLIELPNVSQWTAKYKDHRPDTGEASCMWGILFHSPSPALPSRSPATCFFEPAVIDEMFVLDRATSDRPRARRSSLQLFHIDKQRQKFRLQHVEIDVVILTTRKLT